MAYSPTNWKNGATPEISAENLNKIEQALARAYDLGPGNVQNANTGVISKIDIDVDTLKYAGLYYVSGDQQKNSPFTSGWTVEVNVFSNDYVLQIATNSTGTVRYMRYLRPGISKEDWKLIAGSRILYQNTNGIGAGGGVSLVDNLSRYGNVLIYTKEYPTVGIDGTINTANSVIRASVSDIVNATGSLDTWSVVLTYTSSSNVATVARAFQRSESPQGAISTKTLTVTKVVGLP